MARPGVRLGPGERVFAEGAVCVGKECMFVFAGGSVCMCVCVCEVWGRPGKVARLSLRDQGDRRSLI